jgi:hypothetical protein
MNGVCVNSNGANAQVGLRGPLNTDFLNRQGSGNTAHTASTAGTLNNQLISHGANNFFNGNGGMRFTPTFQKPVVSPSPTATNICPDVTVELSTTSPVAIKQWYNNNLPIAAATNSSYTADASGTHLLVVSQGGCSKVSDPVDVTIDPCFVCTTVFGIDKIETCDEITWIDGITYTSNNYTATFLLEGASQDGCDSLVTLNLTFWPCIQLSTDVCGVSNIALDQALFASLVGQPAYRFKITGNNVGNWNNNSFVVDRNVRWIKFNPQVTGEIVGQTYTVEVAVGDGLGNFGPYGIACDVTLTPNQPTTQLNSTSCSATNVNPTAALFAIQVQEALGYRFRISGANNGGLGWVNDQFILNRTERWFKFAPHVPGFLTGETYDIEVAVLLSDGITYGPYGTLCEITLSGTPNLVLDENEIAMSNKSLVEVVFGVNASHNPFTTEFGIQVLNANDSETIDVVIYDMSGKLIERQAVNPMDIESAKFGSNLASGMYMVAVKQGSNQAVIRQVKN